MKERPILMSGPMVRAILDGRKTQTRRVVKDMPEFVQHTPDVHPPKHDAPYFDAYCGQPKTAANPRGMSGYWCWWTRDNRQGPGWVRCPYGVVGDRLWVRETFMGPDHIGDGDQGCVGFGVLYKADDSFVEDRSGCACEGPCSGVLINHPWKPSIFMPRRLSRLTVEITDVRVERVQSISYADVLAEGCPLVSTLATPDDHEWYRALWDSLNEKRGYSWESNPYVWVLSFKRVEEARAAA